MKMMMMMMMMMKMSPWLLLLVIHAAAAGPGSCVARCGETFTRGQQCTCDFSCMLHNECCPDYQAVCIAAQSCQGRCGETFRRGQLCECDPQCIYYNTCCPDYQLHCNALDPVSQARNIRPGNRQPQQSRKRSNSDSEEWYIGLFNPMAASSPGSAPLAGPSNPLHHGVSNIPVGLLPMSHGGAPPDSSVPSYSAPSVGTSASGNPSGRVNVHLVLSHGRVAPSGPSQDVSRPSTLQDVAQGLGLYAGTGLFPDVNLCSEVPINGLTALNNGTILIFKGELFWSVDPASRSVGRPHSITQTLGVSSPIDTVFTRSNCHGNTYIIKGDLCWRLDGNMAMVPGYPKPLASEFPGLTGNINAALAVPATRNRAETVYFFKSGDIMQRFTFPAGSTPSCSKTTGISFQRRLARQAEVLLSGEINLRVSLKGLPVPVTSALSMPSPQRNEPHQLYVFSGPFFFSVQISGNLPVLVKPDPSAVFAPQPILSSANMAAQSAKPPHPANSITVWLRCP